MTNVYVVVGSSGEYSDRTEWGVVAFISEDAAKDHVEKATKRAKELEATRPTDWTKQADHFKSNEFDPDMKTDYTGTSYYYITVELRP